MNIKKHLFGNGEIESYTLSRGEDIALTVTTYGATLQSVKIRDRQGAVQEVTLGFDDPQGYKGEHPYYGSTVGRVAGRISGARFTLDGKQYKLAENAGSNHLHGGIEGFNRKIWSADPFEEENRVGVTFSYTSPDGEEGYPGTLSVQATYTLTDAGELFIDYHATTDQPTPINLTNHAYWNLDGPQSDYVGDHLLTVFSDNILEVDDVLTPTGKTLAVEGTAYDFRREKAIDEAIKALGGVDHYYVFHDNPRNTKMVPAAKLRSPSTGIALEIETTQPGMQLYTSNFLEGSPGRNGAVEKKHGAVCLETQNYPDAVNREPFPEAILYPGEEYRHSTKITFSRG
jgi:aldose 1-epimerase